LYFNPFNCEVESVIWSLLQNPPVINQTDVIDFLADLPSHGGNMGEVERIDTHAPAVFLVGAQAFKLKRVGVFVILQNLS
jgi:hypothetical protein|tara:strand:- start:787 stop:1026 length:240 start_codon:yes stop_codon:yes gene_type:complete